MSKIRNVEKKDLNALKTVIGTTGLFPSGLLDEMMSDYFTNPATEDIWLTKEVNGVPISIAYCAQEKLTHGTYNLYLIAVHKDLHSKGIGTEMMAHIEEKLKSAGKRILIVETSGLPEFDRTRKFYDNCKYERAGIIPDFYKEGEDKVIFWKKLNASGVV